MLNLNMVHTAIKAHAVHAHLDGFGCGMGTGIYYSVPQCYYGALFAQLVKMGFTCTTRNEEERIYQCGAFNVFVMYGELGATVSLHSTAFATYFGVNFGVGKLPA